MKKEKTKYNEYIKKYKDNLNTIYESIMLTDDTIHRLELLNLYNNVNSIIQCAEKDPEQFSLNSNHSNTAYSSCYKLMSSKSKSIN